MAPPAPGSDFLESLRAIFAETEKPGRNKDADFIALKQPLIRFFCDCGMMTAAKARASCHLDFSDGTSPETDLQLPPSGIKVDEVSRNSLQRASSGNELIGLMRAVINEQMPRKAPRRRRTKAQIRADNEAQIRAENEAQIRADEASNEAKMIKAKEEIARKEAHLAEIKRITLVMPNDAAPPEDGRPDDELIQAQLSNESLVLGDSESSQGMEGLNMEAKAQSEPMEATAKEVLKDIRASEPPTPKTIVVRRFPAEQEESLEQHAEIRESLRGNSVPSTGDQEDMPMEDFHHGETPEMPEDEASHLVTDEANEASPISEGRVLSIAQIRHEVNDVVSSEWDHYKPWLLDVLANADRASKAQITTTTDIADSARTRLSRALSLLGEEVAHLCTSDQIDTMAFPDRLRRITRVCYLPEEEQAVVSGDWGRVEAAVRICALLAEMVGPAHENLDHGVVDGWVMGKLRDIAWLQSFLGAKERVFKLEPST
ncbi:hypothetical protein G7046_g1400 [Stylonectria norvegica]|nr:hypothetical protein G7046_g1400 [Stylonectria norvegica]